jgi:hypothetical protein
VVDANIMGLQKMLKFVYLLLKTEADTMLLNHIHYASEKAWNHGLKDMARIG